jgi:hypothetical protein
VKVAALAAPLLALLAAGGESGFLEVTEAAGVAAAHRVRSFRHAYAEVMQGYTALGAAVAVGDFDGDGWEDLFVTDSAEDGRNRLYRNRRDFTFEEVAAAAGVEAGNDARNAAADALFFDYDNDGRQDLLVVRFGQSQLFRNQGFGRFRETTREAGLEGRRNSIAALAFDADGDGWLDLVLGNYFGAVDLFAPATPRFFPESFESALNGGGLTFYRNRGRDPSGRVTFVEATVAAGLQQSGWTLDVGHGDADRDGDEDLYVACDFGSDRFLVNDGGGVFRDATAEAIGVDTKKGMNAEWGDYDGDGWLDVFVTNITDDYMREGNFLWRNGGRLPAAAGGAGGGVRFTDVARETGVHDSGWGWGGKFLDFDNDGWQDLFVVNGWVSAGEESYVPVIFDFLLGEPDLADARLWPPMGDRSLSGYQRNRLFRSQAGELFRDEAARHGLDSRRDGRGIAVADLDRDGALDLYVANAGAPPHLYRGRAPAGARWVSFELRGGRSNRDSSGAKAWVTAAGRTRLDFVDGGNGFAGQSSRRLHFGLGGASAVDLLEVEWPSGLRQRFSGLAAGRIYELREGQEPRPAPAAEARR